LRVWRIFLGWEKAFEWPGYAGMRWLGLTWLLYHPIFVKI